MAAPAVMSHQPTTHATHRRSSPEPSFTFESDNELDLSLNNFPMPIKEHSSTMSEAEVPEIAPRGQEVEVPVHPIPTMQGPFAESMLDAFDGSSAEKEEYGDSASRRKLLLEQDVNDETHAGRWKQKPGQRYHELWKLMSQISFGIYLLLKGRARDNEQALGILQTHVDEVDAFLESTLEDFDLAQEDIDDRLKNLKLPLENIHIFDGMLEDRNFRNQIVAGNETIEHIITRTATAMNDALKNVQQGMDATKEFANYMAEQEHKNDWRNGRPDMEKVFHAMKGNADGWCKAYALLQTKGNQLGTSLVQLGTITAEIDRRAAEISRRSRFSLAMSPKTSISVASQAASPPTSSRMSMRQSVRSHSGRPSIASVAKDLPADPAMITPAIAATLPAFQMVSDRDKTQERAKSPSDASSLSYEEDHVQYATLQPRTYTPPPLTPSRYEPPSARTEAKPPTPESDMPLEPPARSSLRKRLSKTRKQAPPPLLQTPAYSSNTSRRSPRSSGSNDGSRSTGSRANHRVQASEASQMTIPISEVAFPSPPTISFTAHDLERSRSGSPLRSSHQPEEQQYANMINGYESDADGRIVSVMGSPSMEYHAFIAASQQQLLGHNFGGGNYVSSPRSEQQMSFQPVQGSDFDPHQRPWTAAGSRLPPGQESYQQYNTGSYGRNQNPQPSRGLGYARGSIFPSNMSQMTSATEFSTAPDGKKVKKKRSGFGWLKKAFALSEEEKAAFEEKKRQAQMENEMARMEARNRERIFLDGKRIR